MRQELGIFLDAQDASILPPIDAWLVSLSDEDLSTVCAGEESEMDAALVSSPPFTSKLLNDYFEEVC